MIHHMKEKTIIFKVQFCCAQTCTATGKQRPLVPREGAAVCLKRQNLESLLNIYSRSGFFGATFPVFVVFDFVFKRGGLGSNKGEGPRGGASKRLSIKGFYI